MAKRIGRGDIPPGFGVIVGGKSSDSSGPPQNAAVIDGADRERLLNIIKGGVLASAVTRAEGPRPVFLPNGMFADMRPGKQSGAATVRGAVSNLVDSLSSIIEFNGGPEWPFSTKGTTCFQLRDPPPTEL